MTLSQLAVEADQLNDQLRMISLGQGEWAARSIAARAVEIGRCLDTLHGVQLALNHSLDAC